MKCLNIFMEQSESIVVKIRTMDEIPYCQCRWSLCHNINNCHSIFVCIKSQLIIYVYCFLDDMTYHETVDSTSRDSSDSVENVRNAVPQFTSESLEQSGPLHISSGNSIRFKCDTKSSSPAPRVMWFKVFIHKIVH